MALGETDAAPANAEMLEATEAVTLPRVLGLFDAAMLVVGSIIGSGIFVTKTGIVADKLGGFGPIIGVWIGVGLATLCGTLAIAELAAMMPHAGGPYVYMSAAFGRLPAFLWGWTEFWVVRAGSLGALACATVMYLAKVVELSAFAQGALAILIVVGLSAINIAGTRWAASLQNLTSVIKIAFLGLIIGLPLLLGHAAASNLEPMLPPPSVNLWSGLGAAVIAVMWPYNGWIDVAPVAEEVRDPQKNLPRGLGLGMLIVILVYVGANISYHLTLPMHEVRQSATIASDVFGKLFGPTGVTIAALGVMCSTFGAANSTMLTGPRIYFAMARDGLLPASLCRIHGSYRTPVNAILVQTLWTVILLVLFYTWKEKPQDAFDGLTDSVVIAGLIFYSMSVAAVYVLRRTHPDLPRPYRTWGYPVTPAILLVVYAGALVNVVLHSGRELGGVVGLIVAGFVFYLWASRGKRIESSV